MEVHGQLTEMAQTGFSVERTVISHFLPCCLKPLELESIRGIVEQPLLRNTVFISNFSKDVLSFKISDLKKTVNRCVSDLQIADQCNQCQSLPQRKGTSHCRRMACNI